MAQESITRWLGLCALLLCSLGVYGQTQAVTAPKTPIRVMFNWHHQFEYAGFYAAQMLGYYDQAGLDVHLSSWNQQDLIDQVSRGEVDIGVDGTRVLTRIAKGAPLRLLFSSYQYSPLVLLSHGPVVNLSTALRGKKIMFSENYEVYALLAAAGVSVKDVELIPQTARLQSFTDQQVDFYTAYSTNEPFRLMREDYPFHIIDPKTYGVVTYGDFAFTNARFAENNSISLIRFKEATLKGWEYALNHADEVISYLMAHYKVVKNRVDLLNEAKASPSLIRLGDTPLGDIDLNKLITLYQSHRSLGLITSEEYEGIPWDNLILQAHHLSFTEEEIAYLQTHPRVRLANDIDWEPFEYIDQNNQYQGMAADFIRLISQKTGIKFQPLMNTSWQEAVEMMKSGQLDMYSGAVATPERQAYVQFTQPYLTFPMVLLARDDYDFIGDLNQLEGKVVALVQSYVTDDYISSLKLPIQILRVKNAQEGVLAVLNGQADVYAGNLAPINYQVKKMGITGLKVVGQLPQGFDLAMGVRHDQPLLFSIVQKALTSISEKERNDILNKWLQLRIVNEVDTLKLWQLGFATLGIVALLVGLIFWQSRVRQRLQDSIQQIYELRYTALLDSQGHITWVSNSFCQLTGYAQKDLLHKTLNIFKHSTMTTDALTAIWQSFHQHQSWKGEMHLQNEQGQMVWVNLEAVPQFKWGKLHQVVVQLEDITYQKRLEEAVIHDSLTGLYNRRFFNQAIVEELHRSLREKLPIALVMVDIDFFKQVNDRYGHQAGDKALLAVATCLDGHFVRANDKVYRLGGEEFAAIVHDHQVKSLQEHLERLRQKIIELKLDNPTSLGDYLTISLGCLYVRAGVNMSHEEIYRLADQSLYQAKNQGRNQLVLLEV